MIETREEIRKFVDIERELRQGNVGYCIFCNQLTIRFKKVGTKTVCDSCILELQQICKEEEYD